MFKMTVGRKVSQVVTLTCKNCNKSFMPNGRNPQKDRENCSATCASLRWNKDHIELTTKKEEKRHDWNCRCTFCKINRAVNFRIYYIAYQPQIISKVYHSHRWS